MNQTARQPATDTPRHISIDELYENWQRLADDELIVDIRSADDYRQAHVPGSRNLPFATVTGRSDELKPYRRVYFYCYGGKGSTAVATELTEMGFDNLCYVGEAGLSEWQSRGYPVNSL